MLIHRALGDLGLQLELQLGLYVTLIAIGTYVTLIHTQNSQ